MRTFSQGLAFRLTAIGIGIAGGITWIVVAGDDHAIRDVSGWSGDQDHGRTLSSAERVANSDCVSVARWQRHHHGYPPPYLLVKPVAGGPAERLPFDEAWRLATAGEVWTHAACADRTLARSPARSHGSAREGR